ncbi:MAG: nuclear transport factor 2 family protein [Myxococcota bacterium]|nr:nuclear transport factor 2 family protein [Myxococcota bacterium]
MIETCIENWHRNLRGELPGGLDALLADDVVFYSPIVFTPQKGKDVTKLYLMAAGNTFGGDQEKGGATAAVGSKFQYSKEVLSGNQAVLEFETEVAGKYVNGVDIITCNDEGRIVEFKVMIRPLQAVNLMHAQMKAMLEKMQAAGRAPA